MYLTRKNIDEFVDCSFIIVNYNTGSLTKDYIEHLFAVLRKLVNHSKASFEIIIVDNNSADNSKDLLSSLKSESRIEYKYIYLNENLGFGKANNIGFESSTGKYIYILNNDAKLICFDDLRDIDSVFETDVGLVGTKVVYPSGAPQPSFQDFSRMSTIYLKYINAGRMYKYISKSSLLSSLVKIIFRTYSDSHNKDSSNITREVDWCSACSILVKRDVFKKVDGFDGSYFMYSEDEDLCFRIREAGYKIVYNPKIIVEHLVGASSKNYSEFIEGQKVLSLLLLAKRLKISARTLYALFYCTSLLLYPISSSHKIKFKFLRGIKLNEISS
ncbi:glycosyltransferase family 2 protein [Vibrio vulnificus]|nr:glycosyltransferase family 2 protein [Vibrio vulnificus]